MAKKRVGLAAFDKDVTDARFRTFGTDLVNSQATQLATQLETFQQALAAFASSHAEEIRANPGFRDQFNHMCATIGIHPISSAASSFASSGGMVGRRKEVVAIWSKLGLSDLYYDLGVQVIETCRRTKSETGGLIPVSRLTQLINARARKFGAGEVTEEEVVKAVESLAVLDGGMEVTRVGHVQMVRSVPAELSTDQSTVLESAGIVGFVSESMLRINFHWEKGRVLQVLEELLGNGLVWVDDQGAEREYWVPSGVDEMRA